MVERTSDWIKQAKLDLDHAKKSLELNHYEWVCLAAQQAAEKSVKALYLSLKANVWGHGIARLLKSLPSNHSPDLDLIDESKILDRHYIPSRYPNGLLYGTPRENYSKKDAKQAIEIAKKIIKFCESKISTYKKYNSEVDKSADDESSS